MTRGAAETEALIDELQTIYNDPRCSGDGSESAGAVNFQAYLLEGLVRWNEDRHAAAVVEHKKVHDYQLQCDVVAVATKLGVEPVVKPFIQHHTRASSLVWSTVLFYQHLGRPDEGEEEEEAVREVFEEEELEVEEAVDHTIPPPPAASDDDDDDASSSTIIRSSPPQLMEAPEAERHEESPRSEMVLDEPTRGADMDTNFRDPAGQGDLDRLMALVRHLVEFRKVDVLSNKQVVETIDLYNHLTDADKARLKYPARQRPFSVKRRYGTRAQSPSLSRLVEGMISLLTDLHLAEERTRGGRKDRWPGVLLNYERIRRLVLSNRELVRHTMIQLFEVNTQTLRQWFEKRGKWLNTSQLIMGTVGPRAPLTASDLPPPAPMPVQMPVQKQTPVETPSEGLLMPGTSQDRSGSLMKQTIMHQVLPKPVYLMHTSECFVLNLNNALEAFARMSQTASLPASVLQTAAHPAPVAAHPDAHARPTFAPTQEDPMIKEAFKRTRMRQRVKEEERKNQRRISFNICQVCHRPKTKETGHKGYKGYSHCPQSKETYHQFRVAIFLNLKIF
ncbi:hypothetical protein ElyMa_005803400 [Elysia marginata]|uniref:Calponin-homology (CH) domain-containing protein n=1 Tax=Elysia marginata TaxID=1093978 RepID=A0AAV4FTJ4_9GAST|nr:hypothetical protein ElyMa_005803400 [Elysia marginata]